MRKRLIAPSRPEAAQPDAEWLNLAEIAEVEFSSEDAAHPVEAALLGEHGPGWRAAHPGPQTIRLVFAAPQRLRRIQLEFVEPRLARTQEYVLRASADGGRSFREIVRQQFNFSPEAATGETEDHRVELAAVAVLELVITPQLGGGGALASLARLRLG